MVIDFEKGPPSREAWRPDLQLWQRRLKLHFDADGRLVSGPPPRESDEVLATGAL
jgi:hypothetical protein